MNSSPSFIQYQKIWKQHKNYTIYIQSLYRFIQSWGGSVIDCDNKSAFVWFGHRLPNQPDSMDAPPPPSYIYTYAFNADSLNHIRSMIIYLRKSANPGDTVYQNQINHKLILYSESVHKEKPFLYYFWAPFFHRLPMFLYGAETKLYLARGQSFGLWASFFEACNHFFYLALLFLGLAGMVLMLFTSKDLLNFLVPLIPLYTMIIHPIILGFYNSRYLMPAWPFIIMGAAYFILYLFRKLFVPLDIHKTL
jgi:hypothetical protein